MNIEEFSGLLAKEVVEDTTGCQIAIPDGKDTGDLFFVTSQNEEIIVCLFWDGLRWLTEPEFAEIAILSAVALR